MEPDLTEFLEASNPRKPMCTVGTALGLLSAGERAQLEAALAMPNAVITARAICLWLERRGHGNVKYGFVRCHRNHECSCYAR